MDQQADFEDEDDENDVHNNYLTQAELFRSYTEQNRLYINIANIAHWFEYGGRRMGTMNIDPINLEKMRQRKNGQVMEYDDCSEPKQQEELPNNPEPDEQEVSFA